MTIISLSKVAPAFFIVGVFLGVFVLASFGSQSPPTETEVQAQSASKEIDDTQIWFTRGLVVVALVFSFYVYKENTRMKNNHINVMTSELKAENKEVLERFDKANANFKDAVQEVVKMHLELKADVTYIKGHLEGYQEGKSNTKRG